ncbi:hypothetical protein DER46DRAFT_656306 [Fusarium sp. MPI-SDFR-AT-0072]|nr:hypothetical protein DER46DRAFT_656306 [Fusarium sp. MPI-SDFR-AT-0072]
MKLELVAQKTRPYDLSLTSSGNAKCLLDDQVVLDVERDLNVSTEDFLFDRSKLETTHPCQAANRCWPFKRLRRRWRNWSALNLMPEPAGLQKSKVRIDLFGQLQLHLCSCPEYSVAKLLLQNIGITVWSVTYNLNYHNRHA